MNAADDYASISRNLKALNTPPKYGIWHKPSSIWIWDWTDSTYLARRTVLYATEEEALTAIREDPRANCEVRPYP